MDLKGELNVSVTRFTRYCIFLLPVILMYFFHPLPWNPLPFEKREMGNGSDGAVL